MYRFISEGTGGLIKEMLTNDAVDRDTRLVSFER